MVAREVCLLLEVRICFTPARDPFSNLPVDDRLGTNRSRFLGVDDDPDAGERSLQ